MADQVDFVSEDSKDDDVVFLDGIDDVVLAAMIDPDRWIVLLAQAGDRR